MDAIVTAALDPGRSYPLGASLVAGGVNFSVFSKRASAVQLLLFDDVDDESPSRVIDLAGRTHHYWHTFVPHIEAGQLYGYRAHGPYAPEKGLQHGRGGDRAPATLFVTGTPMLLMGDEIRRTQGGNNNGYCLDDETAWFDWSGIESPSVRRACCRSIARR